MTILKNASVRIYPFHPHITLLICKHDKHNVIHKLDTVLHMNLYKMCIELIYAEVREA